MKSNESHFPRKQNTLAFLLTIITPEEMYVCRWMNGQIEGGTEGRQRGETKKAHVDEEREPH